RPGGDWQDAREGFALSQGDQIHTGPESSVTLKFSDGTTMLLKELTHINVVVLLKRRERVKVQILLKLGELKSQVKRQEAVDSDYSVQTPTNIASVRGTDFDTLYDEAT